MVFVSEAVDHIGLIYSPLNLAHMKIIKLKFVPNTALDNQMALNFMSTLTGAYILVYPVLSYTRRAKSNHVTFLAVNQRELRTAGVVGLPATISCYSVSGVELSEPRLYFINKTSAGVLTI